MVRHVRFPNVDDATRHLADPLILKRHTTQSALTNKAVKHVTATRWLGSPLRAPLQTLPFVGTRVPQALCSFEHDGISKLRVLTQAGG